MHNIVQMALIRWLKRADFRNIRTNFVILLNGGEYHPDVYAERDGKKYLFEITLTHLNFIQALGCIKNEFNLFLVMPHEDFIDDQRIEIFKIMKEKDIVVDIAKLKEMQNLYQ